MILIVLYSLVAFAASQRQEQPLCPTLRNLYDAHCPSNGTRSPMLVSSRQVPGKRGPVGPKGEKGLDGQKGEKGGAGEVDYDRLDNMISQRTRGDAELPTSCFHLLREGQTTSGIYSIKPSTASSTIEVYCDMVSTGGGWTLVASVHENDIKGKCTIGDKWSSEIGRTSHKSTGSMNWENLNTFGTADGATSSDYKSPAYFNVQASDVMIWHVPNDVRISEASLRATLKYYTDTRFLSRYGGTLQSLFHQHYPMRIRPLSFSDDYIKTLSRNFHSATSSIRSLVPSFHWYTYDFSSGFQNYIEDGGNDMYDNGNKVFYQIGGYPEKHITYDQFYSNSSEGEEVKVLASTSHPFNVLMWIGNTRRAVSSFSLKVIGNAGADGTGSYTSYSGSLTNGNTLLSYHTYNVYSASDSSITKVFYYMSDAVRWRSVPPASFLKTPWSTGTDSLQHGVQLTGSPRAVLMGYMLLSKEAGVLVSDTEVRSVLSKTMEVLRGPPAADCGLKNQNDSLVQPIQYLRGDNEKVLSGLPPRIRAQSTPGFIQFRAYSELAIPHSICPGAKTDSCRPQSLCLGAMNSAELDETMCGDFSGWGGSSGDTPNATHPDGYARSLNDQQSSILIFTRPTNDTLP